MKISIGRVAAASVVALGAVMIAAPASAKKIDNQYICVFNPGLVAKGKVKEEAGKSAKIAGGLLKHTYENSIRGFAVNASAQAVAKMQANNPRIAYCEQDAEAVLVAGKPGGGGGSTVQRVPYGITRVNGGVAGNYARAFVIDTGIDPTHPDLNVDTSLARNFSRESDYVDNNGHGTHVAGTIAAINNAIGVIGVAPGARVVPVKVLNRRGSGSCSDITAGVDYVASVGQANDVANMSVGCPPLASLDAAVVAASAKLRFALAAANDSADVSTVSPARVNGPNIWTISAIDSNDRWANFSNYGNGVDYAEPGVAVLSTYKSGGYATLSGTSMATPHFAGLLLLGAITKDGTAIGDPDGVADPIGVH